MFCWKLFELFKNQHLGNICCLCCFCGMHLWTGKMPFLIKIHENRQHTKHSKSLRNGSTCDWNLEICSAWPNSTFMSQGNIFIKSFFRSKNGFKSHSYAETCLKSRKMTFFHWFFMLFFVALSNKKYFTYEKVVNGCFTGNGLNFSKINI